MDKSSDNIQFYQSSDSETVDAEVLISEQQVYDKSKRNKSPAMDRVTNVPEKRVREDSEELIEDDDGFVTVRKDHKRTAKNRSRNITNIGQIEKEITPEDSTFVVCLTGKEELPKQFGMAKLLQSLHIQNVLKIKYKNLRKAYIYFENKDSCEKLIQSDKISSLDYNCHLINEVNISYGIIRQIDLNVDDKEILQNLKCDTDILSVRRLKRQDSRGEWIPSETVRIGFSGSRLPTYAYGYGCRFNIEPYVFPVSQCSNCWKYGHLRRSCPLKYVICPKCAENHPNCDTQVFKCVNCKGNHMALNKGECPIFLKEKMIRNIMSESNSTYKQALETYLSNQKNLYREVMIDSTQQTQIMLNIVDKPSYKEVLMKKTTEYEENTKSENEAEEMDTDQGKESHGKVKQNSKKKKRGSHRSRLQETDHITSPNENLEKVNEQSDLEEPEVKRSSVGVILRKLKEICFSKNNVEVKIKLFISFIMEEAITFIVKLLQGGNIWNNILLMFNNG